MIYTLLQQFEVESRFGSAGVQCAYTNKSSNLTDNTEQLLTDS